MKRFAVIFILTALLTAWVLPASAYIPAPESERFVQEETPSFDDRFECDLGVLYPSMSLTTADWIRLRTPRRYPQKVHVPGMGARWVICQNNPVMYTDPTGKIIRFAVNDFSEGQLDNLLSEIAELSGLDRDDLSINESGDLTMNESNRFPISGSKYARDTLRRWINDKTFYMMVHNQEDVGSNAVNRYYKSPISRMTGKMSLNCKRMATVNDRPLIEKGADPLTFGIGAIFFHEGFHAFDGYIDEPDIKYYPSLRTSVEQVNIIRAQAGLWLRKSYLGRPSPMNPDKMMIYFYETDGAGNKTGRSARIEDDLD